MRESYRRLSSFGCLLVVVFRMEAERRVPRSLVYATDLDVLALDRMVERRSGHLIVRSPGNPAYFWGNFLFFDDPPGAGDGASWEEFFAEAFADEPRVRHRAFAWDTVDGRLGLARQELEGRGYAVEEHVGLVADAGALRPHERENREVEVRALDPFGDAELREGVLELQLAGSDPVHQEGGYRAFGRARQIELRELFRVGRGAWYVALVAGTTEVVGSCGIVVTAGRSGDGACPSPARDLLTPRRRSVQPIDQGVRNRAVRHRGGRRLPRARALRVTGLRAGERVGPC